MSTQGDVPAHSMSLFCGHVKRQQRLENTSNWKKSALLCSDSKRDVWQLQQAEKTKLIPLTRTLASRQNCCVTEVRFALVKRSRRQTKNRCPKLAVRNSKSASSLRNTCPQQIRKCPDVLVFPASQAPTLSMCPNKSFLMTLLFLVEVTRILRSEGHRLKSRVGVEINIASYSPVLCPVERQL